MWAIISEIRNIHVALSSDHNEARNVSCVISYPPETPIQYRFPTAMIKIMQ